MIHGLLQVHDIAKCRDWVYQNFVTVFSSCSLLSSCMILSNRQGSFSEQGYKRSMSTRPVLGFLKREFQIKHYKCIWETNRSVFYLFCL